jgi:diguanylate cyclase (GGDEF)-like protein
MRGRVLVIGDAAVANRAMGELGQPGVHAADIFDALGQLAAATAREPIIAVVLVASDFGTSLHDAASSIRKLDPSVPLVLLHGGELDEATTHALGMLVDDMVLIEDTDHLRRAIDGRAAVDSHASSRPRLSATADASPPSVDASQAAESADRPEVLVVETTLRAKQPEPQSIVVPDAVTQKSQEVAPATAPRRSPGPAGPDYFLADSAGSTRDRLGDVDLIDAILHEPTAFESRALRLIAQQTGLDDVQLLREKPKDDLDGSFAAVQSAGQSFGYLTSAGAREDDLATWADWLARWLAMAQSHAMHHEWAYKDDLTEAWNRRYFSEFLSQVIRSAQKQRRPVTLMVFDIDDFKRYNDRFGHEAGDEILRETVKLLTSVIRKGDRVCRIGGDEFAVIFADPEGPRETGSTPPETVEQIARRFQDQICAMKFPKLATEAPGPLTISAGLATYPWDGHDPASLLKHADELALESKRRGKNVMTLGPGAAGASSQVTGEASDR